MPMNSATLVQLGLDQIVPAEVNGRHNGVVNDPAWDAAYHPCAEAFPTADVMAGLVQKAPAYQSSVYPGTTRDLWLYQTSGCDGSTPPQVIFFNDGAWYLGRQGPVRATQVLDSLFSLGHIKATVAIFINPGQPDHPVQGPIASYNHHQSQRSLEYDQLSGRYGEFLFDEIFSWAETQLGFACSRQPIDRTLCGISSGGIAAFNAAWHFPDQCQRVISHCGSYTDIWGGHNYPSLIRTHTRKPLRVFLQSGQHDVKSPFGDWSLANQMMASAFDWAGYDYRFAYGDGGHNLHHGGALFADTLRWLWRD